MGLVPINKEIATAPTLLSPRFGFAMTVKPHPSPLRRRGSHFHRCSAKFFSESSCQKIFFALLIPQNRKESSGFLSTVLPIPRHCDLNVFISKSLD